MLYAALKTIHLLSIIVWIGGMAFAHFFLRPAAAALEPPLRVKLMRDALARFFSAVLVIVPATLVTGVWMIGIHSTQAAPGDLHIPLGWMVMAALGILMMAIFGHIRFVLFKRLQNAVAEAKWVTGSAALAGIRNWVRINLAIGILIVVAVAI